MIERDTGDVLNIAVNDIETLEKTIGENCKPENNENRGNPKSVLFRIKVFTGESGDEPHDENTVEKGSSAFK